MKYPTVRDDQVEKVHQLACGPIRDPNAADSCA